MATQLNNWLSIDKISGTGNAQITLTASSYGELVDRATSIKIQAQSTNAILNVRQKAYTPIEKNNNYFWIEFENTGGEVSGLGDSWTDIYYSFDANTWTAVDGTGVVSLGTNRLVYLKNNTKKLLKDLDNHTSITFNFNAKIGGDLSSMTDMIGYCCEDLFYNNTYLVDASALILPWATLADTCYSRMFQGCTNLTTAPALPATTLANYCYVYMFYGCTNLTTAPELPATTLAEGCYMGMFYGCTSLVTAPALPATTLANRCYISMFQNCTSLNYIKMLSTDISASNCLYNWVINVAPTGTFVKHPNNTTIPIDSNNGIPIGWTVLTNEQELKQRYFWVEFEEENQEIWFELSDDLNTGFDLGLLYSFDGIEWVDFQVLSTNRKSLSMGNHKNIYIDNYTGKMLYELYPDVIRGFYLKLDGRCNIGGDILTLATMRDSGYYGLFRDSKIVSASDLILPNMVSKNCYNYMFLGCTSLVNAPELPATTLAKSCYRLMFRDCTSLVNAPKLPATTLAKNCYDGMFEYCTSLTTAPELPATILVDYCYNRMFFYCNSLNYIKMLATNISAHDCLYMWTNQVSSTGTFIKHPNNTSIPIDSNNGIPSGWTVETATE